MSNQFNFYNTFYGQGFLTKSDVYEAAKWNVITKDEYETIVGSVYEAK